jgi:hypothetical protein
MSWTEETNQTNRSMDSRRFDREHGRAGSIGQFWCWVTRLSLEKANTKRLLLKKWDLQRLFAPEPSSSRFVLQSAPNNLQSSETYWTRFPFKSIQIEFRASLADCRKPKSLLDNQHFCFLSLSFSLFEHSNPITFASLLHSKLKFWKYQTKQEKSLSEQVHVSRSHVRPLVDLPSTFSPMAMHPTRVALIEHLDAFAAWSTCNMRPSVVWKRMWHSEVGEALAVNWWHFSTVSLESHFVPFVQTRHSLSLSLSQQTAEQKPRTKSQAFFSLNMAEAGKRASYSTSTV